MKGLTISFSIITLLMLLTGFGLASGQITGDEKIFPNKDLKIKVVQTAGSAAGKPSMRDGEFIFNGLLIPHQKCPADVVLLRCDCQWI